MVPWRSQLTVLPMVIWQYFLTRSSLAVMKDFFSGVLIWGIVWQMEHGVEIRHSAKVVDVFFYSVQSPTGLVLLIYVFTSIWNDHPFYGLHIVFTNNDVSVSTIRCQWCPFFSTYLTDQPISCNSKLRRDKLFKIQNNFLDYRSWYNCLILNYYEYEGIVENIYLL